MKRRGALVIWVAVAAAGTALAFALGPAGFGWPAPGSAIWIARRDRVLAGLVVGAGLSTSGTLMQALLRNPLADPYVLGVSGGAALGAALAIVAGWMSAVAIPTAAFLGGLLTLALVYGLSAPRRSEPSLYTLLLCGIIVSSISGALLMLLITLAPTAGLRGITWWMLGSLQVPSSTLLRAAAGLNAATVVTAWAFAPGWNALTLGTDVAHHVGLRAQRAVFFGLALATLATAASVALAGLIGFVGLIVPHAVRLISGADHRRLIPASALAGGTLLVLCDAAARTIRTPMELPVGVITALIGGPFFIALLRRRQGWAL